MSSSLHVEYATETFKMKNPIMPVSSASIDEISALHTPCSRNQSCSHDAADKAEGLSYSFTLMLIIKTKTRCGNAY